MGNKLDMLTSKIPKISDANGILDTLKEHMPHTPNKTPDAQSKGLGALKDAANDLNTLKSNATEKINDLTGKADAVKAAATEKINAVKDMVNEAKAKAQAKADEAKAKVTEAADAVKAKIAEEKEKADAVKAKIAEAKAKADAAKDKLAEMTAKAKAAKAKLDAFKSSALGKFALGGGAGKGGGLLAGKIPAIAGIAGGTAALAGGIAALKGKFAAKTGKASSMFGGAKDKLSAANEAGKKLAALKEKLEKKAQDAKDAVKAKMAGLKAKAAAAGKASGDEHIVTHGCGLKCDKGSAAKVNLVIPKGDVEADGNVVAHMLNNMPGVNIPTFGMCDKNNQANPTVVSMTAAAQGNPTPAPCTPMTPSPWGHTCSDITSMMLDVVIKGSSLKCAFGGTITPAEASSIAVGEPAGGGGGASAKSKIEEAKEKADELKGLAEDKKGELEGKLAGIKGQLTDPNELIKRLPPKVQEGFKSYARVATLARSASTRGTALLGYLAVAEGLNLANAGAFAAGHLGDIPISSVAKKAGAGGFALKAANRLGNLNDMKEKLAAAKGKFSDLKDMASDPKALLSKTDVLGKGKGLLASKIGAFKDATGGALASKLSALTGGKLDTSSITNAISNLPTDPKAIKELAMEKANTAKSMLADPSKLKSLASSRLEELKSKASSLATDKMGAFKDNITSKITDKAEGITAKANSISEKTSGLLGKLTSKVNDPSFTKSINSVLDNQHTGPASDFLKKAKDKLGSSDSISKLIAEKAEKLDGLKNSIKDKIPPVA